MKYIITETQYKLLKEINLSSWFKRRMNLIDIDSIINSEIDKFSDLCDSFDDVDEYVETIIYNAINKLYGDVELPEEYLDGLDEIVEKYLKEMYEDYLIDIFKEICKK
jgi:hypothetical protein